MILLPSLALLILRLMENHKGLFDLATVIGSADFTSNAKRLELLDLLGGLTPLDVEGEQMLLQGLVEEGDAIILVCPIDSAAPKGRLILPQVQTIREILDYKGLALVCQTEELPSMINSLTDPIMVKAMVNPIPIPRPSKKDKAGPLNKA